MEEFSERPFENESVEPQIMEGKSGLPSITSLSSLLGLDGINTESLTKVANEFHQEIVDAVEARNIEEINNLKEWGKKFLGLLQKRGTHPKGATKEEIFARENLEFAVATTIKEAEDGGIVH